MIGKVGGHLLRRLQRALGRVLDEIDLLFLLAMKCTNMFNGRRERVNVSFHSSNAHASFLSLSQTHAHKYTRSLMSAYAHLSVYVEVNSSFAVVLEWH